MKYCNDIECLEHAGTPEQTLMQSTCWSSLGSSFSCLLGQPILQPSQCMANSYQARVRSEQVLVFACACSGLLQNGSTIIHKVRISYKLVMS